MTVSEPVLNGLRWLLDASRVTAIVRSERGYSSALLHAGPMNGSRINELLVLTGRSCVESATPLIREGATMAPRGGMPQWRRPVNSSTFITARPYSGVAARPRPAASGPRCPSRATFTTSRRSRCGSALVDRCIAIAAA